MRIFDFNALERGTGQIWSSLDKDNTLIKGLRDSSRFGDIQFLEDPTQGNSQIVSDSNGAISIGTNIGNIEAEPLSDFTITMLIVPNDENLWIVSSLVNFGDDVYSNDYDSGYGLAEKRVGVRLLDGYTLELVWTNSGKTETRKIVCRPEPSLLSLSREGDEVTLELNNQQVSLTGDLFLVENLQLGSEDATGDVLADKVAISSGNRVPRINEYARLFRSQRLDRVARPNVAASFVYLSENNVSRLRSLNQNDFEAREGYQIVVVRNSDEGHIAISRRSSFEIEYSTDFGKTWRRLSTEEKVPGTPEAVVIRHDMSPEEPLTIEATISSYSPPSGALYKIEADGPVYLPSETGYGMYDLTGADISDSILTITSSGSDEIKTLELLMKTSDWEAFLEDFPAVDAAYVDGEVILSDINNDVHHLVIVFEQAQQEVVLNEGLAKNTIVYGIGGSPASYAQSDAYYIFNTFAGNTYVSALSEISRLSDGESPSSEDNEPASAINLEWNR